MKSIKQTPNGKLIYSDYYDRVILA